MSRLLQSIKTTFALTSILTTFIYTASANASQCQGLSGTQCYKVILASVGAIDGYVPYFGSEIALINFARTIGNNTCSAIVNANMSVENASESAKGQYRSQLMNKGMSRLEAEHLTSAAVLAGTEVDCPTHINRTLDGTRIIDLRWQKSTSKFL
ncbi:hypothetical protein Glo7428_2323 [Gloeocapsa sp. PCC 7428]|uniref:hypothetical protein n=1 Tax=Gloeocapsa sp. PCC 7428 TaxID=1173026 RepID=UPI0002A5F9AD|nr:hypothetical protein [Gloeocapsa sp. PCC 7428]AFZ30835.1 hypothetical protein Glo7428_2323 [Gloeocapsa sp. PCC 7428]